ncbi:MAG: sulfatase-like hydrolase/transferase, partial [Bacteroidetes bacterium]|nr:sulfatase-like hydrolase/transferase [Bacteroidota bacterium]
ELNKRYHTPAMETLAEQGMKFTQAYACPLCSPTRVSLMTGVNSARHMVTNWTLRKNISPDRDHETLEIPVWNVNGLSPVEGIENTFVAKTLPMYLQEVGYTTIHAGKAHWGAKGTPGEDPLNLGFDVNIAGHAAGGPGSYYGKYNFSAAWRNADRIWDVPGLEKYHGQEINITEALTLEAMDEMQKAVEDKKPFYLYMSHYAIHAPWEKDERFYQKYADRGLSDFEATYASMIESMDKSLGDIMNKVRELAIEDNTIIMFMSDNGSPSQCPQNEPLRGCKISPYEGGIREPMIVYWPSMTKAGSVCNTPLIIEDFFPTILEMGGVNLNKVSEEIDGISFIPLLQGKKVRSAKREFFWHFPHNYGFEPYSVIRKGDWKLINWYKDGKTELYNIPNDISEKIDLSTQHPEIVEKLVTSLGKYLKSCGAGIPMEKSSSQSETIELAKPSEIQYKWHEQERIMFVCLDPCTWQGREYDNHSVPLDRINPKDLNTDQWCEVAQSWGAKEILFVAKHTGGFCWWQTETTDYGIRNTPYKEGKGDVLKELSESCKEYGLNLGIYVYPGDETWGAGIGSGGLTKDSSKQEVYNKVFRQQLTETLTNYGETIEVWFDGSCKIDVSDILEKYAKNSVIFQGPHATLRWPGTESGKLFYPAWNTVKSEDFETGVSTQIHGDPDGDIWAPLETNTTLYDHHWFWSPEKEKKRKSLDQLMECYYKSVGYGSVFLLNSTPDTNGLIPADDIKLYKAFRQEIDRRFKKPLAAIKNKKGELKTLNFKLTKKVNHLITMEDYRQGHRIREYSIEGYRNGQWEELYKGQSVGRKKIDFFPDVEISKIRIKALNSIGEPLIRSLSAYYVEDFIPPKKQSVHAWSTWARIGQWDNNGFENGIKEIKVDLSAKIKYPGQFSLKITPDNSDIEIEIVNAEIHYEGHRALDEFVTVEGNSIQINRTAQVTDESSSVIYLSIKCQEACKGIIEFKPALIY